MIRKLDRKRAHQIYKLPDGKRVVGTSTIAKIGDSGEGLIKWAWNLGRQGIDYAKARDEAGDIGTCAHWLIECYLSRDEADLSEFSPYVTDIARRCFDKFLAFWLENKLAVTHSELQLTSQLHRYGGTLDCIATDEFGKRVLLDFKSSNYHYKSHFFQLAGYKHLFEENNPSQMIDRFCIVRIPKDEGECDPKWKDSLEKEWRVFLAQLSLFNAMKEKE